MVKVLGAVLLVVLFVGCEKKSKILTEEAPVMAAAYDGMSTEKKAMKSVSMPSSSGIKEGSSKKNIQSGTLTAGMIDDNLNIDLFSSYANDMAQKNETLPFLNLKDRMLIQVIDKNGKGVGGANVFISTKDTDIKGITGSDGMFYFYPSFYGVNEKEVKLYVTKQEDKQVFKTTMLNTNHSKYKVVLDVQKNTLPTSLDVMFVIDTTGSMGDELAYVNKELESIVTHVKETHKGIKIRFSLVVYKDQGDEYVANAYPFTSSLDIMQMHIASQKANGGGDYPEAMEVAYEKALNQKWKGGNRARVMFLIADAPPHDEKIKKMYTLNKKAIEKGIHVYSLAASGVGDKAEYIMRQTSLLSGGAYLFLTDDSGVGNAHAEPHSKCYQVTRLDSLMVRVISNELNGVKKDASSDDVIRTVGDYRQGVCR